MIRSKLKHWGYYIMEFAINSIGQRIRASNANKIEEYRCPICRQKVVLKKCYEKVDHFAHPACSDKWHYDMSEWHLEWQSQFPPGNREVVIEYKGEKHRADVMACGYVIEFQHSPISTEEFNERNTFYRSYGKKVVWIFDFISEFEDNKIECYEEWVRGNDSGGKFRWTNPKRFLQSFIPQNEKDVIVFFQNSEYDHNTRGVAYMERVIWAIEEDGISNFKRFFTSYNPGNAIELLECIKQHKL